MLSVLHCFVSFEDQKSTHRFKDVLQEFCSLHFPSKSTEFEPGSQKYDDYVTAIRKMLQALQKTGSPDVSGTLHDLRRKIFDLVWVQTDFQDQLDNHNWVISPIGTKYS